MHDRVVTVDALGKTYGDVTALAGVSFDVRAGEVFGLLGPNGAGKTTTLECIEGLRPVTSGRLSVLGVDPTRDSRGLHTVVGVQLQDSGMPPHMTVEEALRFTCSYHGVPTREDLLERLGLDHKRTTRFSALSTGQKRRLALAMAVAHRPRLVILDEPTAGLDVPSRVELHQLIREMRADGTSFLLATHDMAEAEDLADRVAILVAGRIVAEGSPLELTAAGEGFTKISVRTRAGSLNLGDELPAVAVRRTVDEYLVVFSREPSATVPAVFSRLAEAGDELIDLRVERPSLEERFLELMKPEAVL
ncbi:MAG TPA: ABC transporter ATP-binding protein [Acidimicrobiia bacterium]